MYTYLHNFCLCLNKYLDGDMGAALKTSLSTFVVINEVYRAGETLKPRGLYEGTCDRLKILFLKSIQTTEMKEKQGHFIGTVALLMDDELGKAGVGEDGHLNGATQERRPPKPLFTDGCVPIRDLPQKWATHNKTKPEPFVNNEKSLYVFSLEFLRVSQCCS